MMPSLIFQLLLSGSAPCCQQTLSWSYHPALRIIQFLPAGAFDVTCGRERAYGTHEYARQWLARKTQICSNLSGEHNDAREDNLVDGRVHSPHSSMTACTMSRSRRSHSHSPLPAPGAERVNGRRRGRPPLPCTRPGKRRAARHGSGSWLAKATRRASPKQGSACYGLALFTAWTKKAGWQPWLGI